MSICMVHRLTTVGHLAARRDCRVRSGEVMLTPYPTLPRASWYRRGK
jgi:hypothetical protein